MFSKMKNKVAALLLLAMTAGMAAAQTAPSTPEEAITSGSTTILAIVAVFGVAAIGIALAGVGWRVGVKFIKRLAGAA